MFKIIDLKRVGSESVMNLLDLESRTEARQLTAQTSFYELILWAIRKRLERLGFSFKSEANDWQKLPKPAFNSSTVLTFSFSVQEF